MLVSESQSSKAELPILVTLSGIVISAKLVQPLKALISIRVTVSGILIRPAWELTTQ